MDAHQQGSGLEVHQAHKPPYYSPHSEAPSTPYYQQPKTAPAIEPTREDRKVLGFRLATVVLSCALFLVITGVIVMGGVFGTKLNSLETKVAALEQRPGTTRPDDATATPLNNNAPTTTPTTAGSDISSKPPSSTTTTTGVSSPAATADMVLEGWTYIGCYKDYEDNRVLTAEVSGSLDQMTNEWCAEHCTKHNYFGTQTSDQCFCSDDTKGEPNLERAPDKMCSKQCEGSKGVKNEVCGGPWYLSVWRKDGVEA